MPDDGQLNPARETFYAGQRIAGRYLLKRVLGRGGMSVVWLAWDAKVEHDVALKFLSAELWGDKSALERLRMEAKRSLQLTHPNIVRTYDFIHEAGYAAIAMEFVDGWSLWALRVDRPQKRYRVAEIFPWIQQLCGALDYAHNHVGIVHCDLKPSNLMLNAREILKITDFGLAQRIRGINLRTDNLILGTDGFISPQRAQASEEISLLDDVYSIGATIFDLLTGEPPLQKVGIENADDLSKWNAPKMSERLAARDIEEKIPEVWEETVAAYLDPDPAKRPQSAAEVLQMLERTEIAQPVGLINPSDGEKLGTDSPAAADSIPESNHFEDRPHPISTAPLPIWRRRWFVITAGIAAMLIAVAAAWIYIKAGSDGDGEFSFGANRKPNSPGTIDSTFSAGEGADREIRAVAVQPDGKILVGGLFDDFSASGAKYFARLAPNGAVDKSFLPQPGSAIHTLALSPDGKIIVGGEFQTVQGEAHRRTARFYDDGSIDPTFAVSLNREARTVLIQSDGKILLSGSFDGMGGKLARRIARVTAAGKRDESFNIGNGSPAIVWALALQPDGKILAVGDFTSFDQKPFSRIVRLNPGGSMDEKFSPGDGANATVYAIVVQPDGKILIAGDFIQVHGVEWNRIARLNADGSLDTTFNPGAGPNSGVRCIALQPDGKILIGGIFTSV